jgi:hypothetical protein
VRYKKAPQKMYFLPSSSISFIGRGARVSESANNIYILNKEDPKGIRQVWGAGQPKWSLNASAMALHCKCMYSTGAFSAVSCLPTPTLARFLLCLFYSIDICY